jgi:hypothetical protein
MNKIKTKKCVFYLLVLISANLSLLTAQIIYEIPQKKLIDFGWHSPTISDMKDNINKFEKEPFDGVAIKIPATVSGGNIFMVTKWKEVSSEAKEQEMKNAAAIPQSSVLTDNFLSVYGASQMDWFSDEDWALVTEQIKYVARLAKAAKCKGILWDPEPYKPGGNPWRFREQKRNSEFSYQDYYRQVRKRGAQFIQTFQDEFPGLVILSLREFSDFQDGSPFSAHVLPVLDSAKAIQRIENSWWALHIPFTVGILDAIKSDVLLVDTNEDAYFYTSALEYYRIKDVLKNDGRALVPPETYSKFASQYQLGHAISCDYIAGNWLSLSSFPYRLKGQAKMMSPEQRTLWFEHNSYYAFLTSDRYVWLYTERANWWTGENVPEGFADALIRAKKKALSGQPLGFEIEKMIKEAQAKAEEFYKNK